MGDRGNIVIEEDEESFTAPVYLYTHWNGYKIKQTLQAALIRGNNRWCDGSYLARIIFSEMIKDHVLDEAGFGISTVETESQHDLLFVNIQKRVISEGRSLNAAKKVWTFNEFVTAKFETLEE